MTEATWAQHFSINWKNKKGNRSATSPYFASRKNNGRTMDAVPMKYKKTSWAIKK